MFALAQVEKVVRHLMRMGASPADAQDLAQEALVIAWRRKDDQDRERSLEAWLYGIVKNVYRNHVRADRRNPVAVTDDAMARAEDQVADAPAVSIVDAMVLREAVQALPEQLQDIVILHELEGHTLKETAELLAVPFETAKDRLRRARETLRASIGEDWNGAVASERRATGERAAAVAVAVLVGFAGTLAAGGAAHATTVGAARVAAGTAGAAGVGKLAVMAALVFGLAGGVLVGRTILGPEQRLLPPMVALVVADRAAVDDALAQVAVPMLSAPPAPAPPTGPPSLPLAPPLVAATAPTDSINAESLIIDEARTALARGNASDALRTLMSHERRFPSGQLAEERDVLVIDAYVALGNTDLTRDRIDAYLAAYPKGAHRAHVLSVQASLP